VKPGSPLQGGRAAWPGTRLVGQTATVHRSQLTAAVLEVLRGEARRRSAGAWRHPPAALARLARDETPWPTSSSHERDASLRLPLDEVRQLLTAGPDLTLELTLERDPPPPVLAPAPGADVRRGRPAAVPGGRGPDPDPPRRGGRGYTAPARRPATASPTARPALTAVLA
jgi:hypothetical protein